MKKLTTLLLLLTVAAGTVWAQPARAKPTKTLGLLPYMEQSNFRGFQDIFISTLTARLNGTSCRLLSPKATLAKFKKGGIDPRRYVANPKSFTGSEKNSEP
ncbi:MAG: hypothetical protein K1X67_14615 [Fimbriimonadaceae bacterium]|nr:hypothetical protein [Fimbriimonadaceae bacterium]